MFDKYLIVASKKDAAGINITTQLSQFGDYHFYLPEEEIIYTENLDLEKINQYDFIIFASRHQSEKPSKTLSIHAPGNPRGAAFGGIPGKFSKTSALFMKQAFIKLKENAKESGLKYEITMECTHHGPLIEKPCMFIEIGSGENEWNDRRAGFVIAKTISEVIKEFKENPYNEIAIAIGGPHYCPVFNKIQVDSNVAIGHVIPQYSLPLTEEMVREALNKTEEEIDIIVIDWKGIGNSEQRQQAMSVLNKFYLPIKRTSDVGK